MKISKNILSTFMLIAAAAFMLSFRYSDSVSPAQADLKQTLADWERAKAYTKEYLDASNDEVINFKPTPEMRTFGQQMLHLAEANYGLGTSATGKATTVTFGSLEKSDQYKTKESVTKAVMDSYDFVIAGVKELNDAKMAESVKVFNFEMPKGQVLAKLFEHQTHHRGQTTVYLRLKGITPPNEKLF